VCITLLLLLWQIREENPRLARDSKVLRVTMDNVYEVFTTPRDQTGLQGIHFRFMPDVSQVRHALEVRGMRGDIGWKGRQGLIRGVLGEKVDVVV
jgi:hypothetical protein